MDKLRATPTCVVPTHTTWAVQTPHHVMAVLGHMSVLRWAVLGLGRSLAADPTLPWAVLTVHHTTTREMRWRFGPAIVPEYAPNGGVKDKSLPTAFNDPNTTRPA